MIRRPVLIGLAFLSSVAAQPLPTDLFLRGYTVIPTPQKVVLRQADVVVDDGWTADGPDGMAMRSLLRDLGEFHSLRMKRASGAVRKAIRLEVRPGAVAAAAELADQAYRLSIAPDRIVVTGNAPAGLFYGVQTLVQLVRRATDGRLRVPECEMEDWPKLKLRFLHWDTKHHQDRMETVKRYLDWSARFKANMIGFELEDKFSYPSHPVIGAPGAFTPAQLQEIVDYGKERFIQVVPVVQSPAHLAYVLKHPEFAKLRADGNNYQSCLCLEDTYKLIFSMYDDVIAATKGVDYFFVSTDEVYYAGIGSNCKEPYNAVNRSLKWAEFAKRAHDHLAAKGRRMLAWVEYPLLPEHIEKLPNDLIDGVVGEDAYVATEMKKGMRQLIYVPIQGAEFLFPDYLPMPKSAADSVFSEHEQGQTEGRLQRMMRSFPAERAMKMNPIGSFTAAWGDSGLHSETFWLGWTAASRLAWNPSTPAVEQHAAEFMDIYYGQGVTGMVEVYRMMQRQARAWQRSWDRVISRARKSGYGNSYGKGTGTDRHDLTLSPPPLPRESDLAFEPKFAAKYAGLVAGAGDRAQESDRLLQAIAANIPRADRNRHNLEVFFALARFMGHHWTLMAGLAEAERSLQRASAASEKEEHAQAVGHMVAAYNTVARLQADGTAHFRHLEQVFEKSRFPKGRSVGGRNFVHVFDDTKDHWADRTADLGYMHAPERSIGLEDWQGKLRVVIEAYAKRNNVAVRGLGAARLEE
jgi:hypothetical protein